MKLIIDIFEEEYEKNKSAKCDYHTLRMAIKNGIPLNDKTNGDIIKALFPDCLISEGENYVSFWYTKEENGRYVNFRKFWWEEPYKENQPKELRCDTCKWNDEELSGECYDCVKGIEDRYEPIDKNERRIEILTKAVNYLLSQQDTTTEVALLELELGKLEGE